MYVLYCTAVASKHKKGRFRQYEVNLQRAAVSQSRNRPSVFRERFCGLTTRVMPVFVVSLTLGYVGHYHGNSPVTMSWASLAFYEVRTSR